MRHRRFAGGLARRAAGQPGGETVVDIDGRDPAGPGLADAEPAACLAAGGDARGDPGDAEILNLEDGRPVELLHIAAIRAGARLVRTNTRQATRPWLERWGLGHRVADLNLWGAKRARAAREVAGEPAQVAGYLGPLPPGAPAGPSYREQVDGLLAGGVDLFWVEVEDPEQAAAAVEAVRAACRLPVGLVWRAAGTATGAGTGLGGGNHATPGTGGVHDSVAPDGPAVARTLIGLAPDALGVAVAGGPGEAAGWLAALRRAGWTGPLWVTLGPDWLPAAPAAGPVPPAGPVLPDAAPARNGRSHGPAGRPVPGRGKHRQGQAREPWRDELASLVALGVSWVGGTGAWTTTMLRALGSALAAASPASHRPGRVPGDGGAGPATPARVVVSAAPAVAADGSRGRAAPVPAVPAPPLAPAAVAAAQAAAPSRAVQVPGLDPLAGPFLPERRHEAQPLATGRPGPRLRQKLGRQFVVSVELDPPRGTVVNKFLADARVLGAAGADCINVGDSPMARVRMSALAGAYLVQAAAGVEAIMHCTTRDRNLMALQADLLAAHALGVRNVLALTGDHPRLGDGAASPVYDVDSIGLLRILSALKAGHDLQGNPTGEPAEFTVACALSPNAPDLDRELERFRQKLEAGVDFVMTQPLYETAPLERVLDRLGGCPVPILMGVMPLHSARHAHYLHHQVPGISIPEPVREALEKAGDRGLEVGLELAEAVVEAARPWIAGVYVVVSFGKAEPVAEFVRRLKTRYGGAAEGSRDEPGREAPGAGPEPRRPADPQEEG